MAELLVVVGLVLVTSAACSLFEAVLYSVPASRIETLDRAGRPSGRILKRMRRHVDQPIAAVLSLNTIANTGGGAVAGALAGSLFGAAGAGVPTFSVAFTLAILLFSEVIPKTVGVVYARGLAPLVARPLQVLVLVFRPLVAVTQLATRMVWSGQHEPRMSDDELLTLVRLGLGSGDLRIDEARVIRNVLSLEKRTAADVMTPRPVVFTLAASVTAQEAAALPELERFSRVPVCDADDPEENRGPRAQSRHPDRGGSRPIRRDDRQPDAPGAVRRRLGSARSVAAHVPGAPAPPRGRGRRIRRVRGHRHSRGPDRGAARAGDRGRVRQARRRTPTSASSRGAAATRCWDAAAPEPGRRGIGGIECGGCSPEDPMGSACRPR